MDSKQYNSFVQVIDRGHLNAAGGFAEGRVLNCLEFLKRDGEVLRNLIGAACMKRNQIRDI